MKLTKEDLDMFRVLSSGDLGKQFIDYLDRLSDNICNSRNWKDSDTKESTTKAAEYITKFLRDKVTLRGKPKANNLNDFE